MARFSRRVGFIGAALLAALPALAAGAPGAEISGTLTGARGARVLALAQDGESVVARTGGGGAFRLRRIPRAALRGASLHVLGRDGRYLGALLLRRDGRRGWTTLARAPVGRLRLGRVTVRRTGVAVPSRPVPVSLLSTRATVSLTASGAPLGAGRLGLGRSRTTTAQAGGTLPADAAPGADPDRDGLPNAVDVDDNGNRTLDAVDPATALAEGSAPGPFLFSDLFVGLADALNANAQAVSPAAIDALVRDRLSVVFGHSRDAGAGVDSVSIDCLGVAWCGSGLIKTGDFGVPPRTPWATFDRDGDGFRDVGQRFGGYDMPILPGATTAQLRPGDTMAFRIERGGDLALVPKTLASYFVTAPFPFRLASGGAASELSTPVAAGSPGTTVSSPVPLADSLLGISFWRPQRPAIPGAGEPPLVDMGGLDLLDLSASDLHRSNALTQFWVRLPA